MAPNNIRSPSQCTRWLRATKSVLQILVTTDIPVLHQAPVGAGANHVRRDATSSHPRINLAKSRAIMWNCCTPGLHRYQPEERPISIVWVGGSKAEAMARSSCTDLRALVLHHRIRVRALYRFGVTFSMRWAAQ